MSRDYDNKNKVNTFKIIKNPNKKNKIRKAIKQKIKNYDFDDEFDEDELKEEY